MQLFLKIINKLLILVHNLLSQKKWSDNQKNISDHKKDIRTPLV